jgi:putative membrane protein
MIAVWITGPALAWVQEVYLERWFFAKAALVILLTWYHHLLAAWRKDLAIDRNRRSPRFYRLVNEVPTALMVGIVLLVVLKPF